MQEFLDHVLGYFGYSRITCAAPAAFEATAQGQATAAPARCIDADKKTLLGVLENDEYEFRSISKLMKSINTTDVAYTTALLTEIGARPAYRNDSKWGLKSVVGDSGRRSARSY